MPHTESVLAWLENLNRCEAIAPRAFADRVETGPAEPRGSIGAEGSAGPDDELQKRLGQVVFSTLCERLGRPGLVPIDGDAQTLRLTSDHLRAARALLGWSMSDLAAESGLSISTIKRIELEPQDVTRRSHRRVVETLRTGGIRFLALDDDSIAVARAARPAPGSAEPRPPREPGKAVPAAEPAGTRRSMGLGRTA